MTSIPRLINPTLSLSTHTRSRWNGGFRISKRLVRVSWASPFHPERVEVRVGSGVVKTLTAAKDLYMSEENALILVTLELQKVNKKMITEIGFGTFPTFGTWEEGQESISDPHWDLAPPTPPWAFPTTEEYLALFAIVCPYFSPTRHLYSLAGFLFFLHCVLSFSYFIRLLNHLA